MTRDSLFRILLAIYGIAATTHGADISGVARQWHTVTLTFNGPQPGEEETPNPFEAYRLTVWFIHSQTTQRYEVPGFFAADGNAAEAAAMQGNKWRVRFLPALTGKWTFRAELKRNGNPVAIEDGSGEFVVSASTATGNDFRRHGHLQYVGERYLREMNAVAKPPTTQVVAIENARLVDGRGRPPLDDACILIKGDRIEFAGPMDEAIIPPGAERFDASGMSVLPGLLDSHFHSRNQAKTLIEYELRNGITSFRDPGHPFKFYSWLANSKAVIPRVFLCGGHLDAPPAAWPDQAAVVETNEQAIDAVNRHVQRGASAIKIYMRLPLEQIRATCAAAAESGVPVTAHLELVDADDAIRAGVAGIEHITSFGTALAGPRDAHQFRQAVTADSAARRPWRPRLWQRIDLNNNPRLDPLLDLIVEQRTFVSPTLAIFEARPGEKEATPEQVGAFENMMRFFALCHRRGARIVVGSHTSAPFAAEGKAYLREVELMAEGGMSPLEIITAATLNNATFFGAQDRLGTIEPGKQADIIIVDGDPTKDIRELDKVSRVMLGGMWIQRD